MTIYYIGKAASKDGIRGRLLQHLTENKWYDVTHFGYEICNTEQESINHEALAIVKFQPKYNKIGK